MIRTESAASDAASAGTSAPARPKNSAGVTAGGGGGAGQEQGLSVAPLSPGHLDAPPARREWAWGAIVVIAGLAAIVAVFIFAALQYRTAAEVTTAVGAVSGVIAALVGAYFGIRGATFAQTNSESSSGATPKTKT